MKQTKRIILASNSPRRKELLTQEGLEFTVMGSDLEEKTEKTLPAEVVMDLSLQKGKNVAASHPKEAETSVLVAADTIVAVDDEILGKPKNEEDAVRMLMELSGRDHSVFTGVAVLDGEDLINFAVETKVKMYAFTEEEARNYAATGEPMDKAGSYGIQGLGAMLVEKIDGDYNNVVGFPLAEFMRRCKGLFLS